MSLPAIGLVPLTALACTCPTAAAATATSLTGDDDSVYIVVSQGEVDTTQENAITDVDGVYTGVQDVKIEINEADLHTDAANNPFDPNVANRTFAVNPVYTVYDGDNYVIASIVIGEAQGATKNYAYILSGATAESVSNGVTYWTFDAIMGGEKLELTIEDKFGNTVQNLKPNTVQELIFNGDYVTKIEDIDSALNCAYEVIDPDDYSVYDVAFDETNKGQGVANGADYTSSTYLKNVNDATALTTTINLYSRTLYTTPMAGAPTGHGTADQNEPVGLTFVTDAPAAVIQMENGKKTTNVYGSVSEALGAMADASTTTDGQQFRGRIVAVLNDLGVAEWVVFISSTPVVSGSATGGFGDGGNDTTLPAGTDLWVTVDDITGTPTGITGEGRYDASAHKLYLKFDGLNSGASKVTLPVRIVDSFGAGNYATLTLDLIEGTDESKVYVTDFTAVDTSNTLGIPMLNRITVSIMGNDTTTEWYVDYDAATGVTFADSSQKTVAVNGSITFSLELPAGAKAATYTWNSPAGIDTTTVTPAFAAINKATTYTVTANGGNTTQPKVSIKLDETNDPVIVQEGSSAGESRTQFKAVYDVAGVKINTRDNTTTISGYDATTLGTLTSELLRIMEGTQNKGTLWVGVNFTSPKDVNGNYADSCAVKVNGTPSTVLPDQYSSANGILYKWVSIASLTTADGTGTLDTVEPGDTYTFEITWTFTGSTNPVVETYTVVTAPAS